LDNWFGEEYREATRRKKSGLPNYVTGQKNLSHNRRLQKTEKD